MKNIIFMQDIDTNRKKEDVERPFYRDKSGVGGDNKDDSFDKDSAVPNPQIHGRRWPGGVSPYKYSIESWRRWAEKNNSEVIVMEDLLCPTEQMGIAWQRHYVMDMLENEGIEYDQICMVDADTIIHPDTPNFFEMTEHKYAGVVQEGSMDWCGRSLEHFSRFVFDGFKMPYENYINSGFQIFNKSHKKFQKEFLDFHDEKKEMIRWVQENYGVGSEQTPINLFLHKKNVDFKFLPYEFNMCDLNNKEILDEELTFTKIGWIYQYSQIPDNWDNRKTLYWMKKTYEHFYGELVD
tara:strand:- start:1682 stop:2563 length:882 start_codon:yes stop_codon:yes gene_type:complete